MAEAVCLTRNSIGKKFLMGLTGLGWVGFVLSHMLGNLLILVSAEAYNRYSHALITNPFLPAAEIGLLLLLLAHVYFAIKLTLENRAARPERYAASPSPKTKTSLGSRTMAFTGSFILVFIILHIITFKYGTHYTATYNGVEMRDLHQLVIEVFHQTGYVAWYVVCLVLLGFHLSHGAQSIFQSLGFRHPRYTPWIKKLGFLYAIVVAAGFLVQPLYVYFLMK